MKVAKCLLISAILVLMLPGIAEALAVVGTHTTLSASKTKVTAGTQVTFTGSLSSRSLDCARGQSLKLYRNGAFVGTVGTGTTGSFSFTNTISVQTTYVVKFKGKIVGVHPNLKVCTGSAAAATVTICVPHPPPPPHPHPHPHPHPPPHPHPHARPASGDRTGNGC